MIIHFPNLNPIVTARVTVAFQAMVDGDTATCEISAAALQAFGATTNQPHDLLTAFVSGKCTIHDVARKLYPHTAGRWLLVSTNFESSGN